MNENNPPRKGRDFLIGFLCSLLIAILAIVISLPSESFQPAVIAAGLLVIGGTSAFLTKRPLIGAGVFSLLLISPFLLIGSCFAVFMFAQ